MTTSPVEKLCVEFGKYIELEQKYKEVETSIAKRVVSTISAFIIIPFLIAGYTYSGYEGMGIFLVIALFVLLVGFGVYHHRTAILNVEKKENRRKQLLNILSFVVANKVQEADNLKAELEKEKDRLISMLKSEDYNHFFDKLYNYVDKFELNDDRSMLRKIEKITTLYDRKFYSVLFHELKMNVCTWNEMLTKNTIH